MKIYIAGPYTHGDKMENVKNAIAAAELLVIKGHVPYIHHLTYFWDQEYVHPYDFWMYQDSQWLSVCDAIVRLPGESNGADLEMEQAKRENKIVFNSLEEIPEA